MDGTPNAIVALAQVVYVLVVVGAFLRLPARRAVLFTVVGGFLFVPVFGDTPYAAPILRDKEMFVPGVVLVASLLFDWQRWTRFHLRLIDLPVVILCVSPIATSLVNDLGLYDGVQWAFQVTMSWGAPYLLGRLYLGDLTGLRDLASTVVAAALVYTPFCLWEVRMSPQLHYTLYGYRPYAAFGQSVRFGGYRPTVFLDHGLMLGMFMAGGALLAFWLWRAGPSRRILGLPIGWAALVLAVASLLTKSLGANLLLVAGVGALLVSRRFRTAALVLALAAIPPAYAAARISGWSAREVLRVAEDLVAVDRVKSLEFRLWNEDLLIAKAMERPGLGWGRWGRGRVYDESGKDTTTTDGNWVIELSAGGLVALTVSMLALIVPVVAFWRVVPARKWIAPALAPTLAVLVWLLLWGIDNLVNAMLSPIFPMAAGALASLHLRARAGRAARVRGPVPRDQRFAPDNRRRGGGEVDSRG